MTILKRYVFVVLPPMKKIILVAIIGMIFSTEHAWAWGARGHGLVAEVAFSLLDSATKERVHKYFSDMTIEQAANWMDNIRSDHKYDYMKTWHYADAEKGEPYTPAKDGDAVAEIKVCLEALKNKDKMSDENIRKNILILMHLVGDLHQPLHVGYGSDKGGNSVQVMYNDRGGNLHHMWDTEIIETEHISLNDCMKRLKNFDKEELDMLSVINIDNWMKQPRSQLNNVYSFKDGTLDEAYVKKNKVIIEDEIAIAGLRLAAILKSTFKA